MEDNKIKMKRSKDADTRSADHIPTKKELLQNSDSHIGDVQAVGGWLAEKFINQIEQHDFTKIDNIDEFYTDFVDVLEDKSKSFKDMKWFKDIHIQKERHHLNDRCPEDVNLLDVLEMVVDCTVAGLARSGNVYPIEISKEILDKAIDNTKQLIIDNTEVEE